MRKLHLTGVYFEIPEDFRISDYLKKETDVSPADNKIYLFELLFPKEIAEEVIEKVYYHNQTIKLREDGTVFVSFRSTRLREVFRWVIGEGRKVKVLNPPELIQKVKDEIEQMRKFYT
jgi:predicted DNA-binding transcriptional regulator YafY